MNISNRLPTRKIVSARDEPQSRTDTGPVTKVYLQALKSVCPNSRIICQITRGEKSATFVLQNAGELRVCQFRLSGLEDDLDSSGLVEASSRMAYLIIRGVEVPCIRSSGKVFIAGEEREYLVMDFVKGVSLDGFLSRHPDKSPAVYERLGSILGKLSLVPVLGKKEIADKTVIDKLKNTRARLVEKHLFTHTQLIPLLPTLEKYLRLLGPAETCYVHLDPFPVNMQITAKRSGFGITLLDVDAINTGHSLVEGLGRALKWGIYDWRYITGSRSKVVNMEVEAFLRGYSEFVPNAKQYIDNPESLKQLLDAAELVGLPLSIIRETKKENPGDYFLWSKNRLLELINS